MLSMVTSIKSVPSEVPQSLCTEVSTNHPEGEDAPFYQNEVVESPRIDTKTKQSKLERTLSKKKMQLD